MAINPDTGSEVEEEDDGDFTVTFSMTPPPQSTDDEEK